MKYTFSKAATQIEERLCFERIENFSMNIYVLTYSTYYV